MIQTCFVIVSVLWCWCLAYSTSDIEEAFVAGQKYNYDCSGIECNDLAILYYGKARSLFLTGSVAPFNYVGMLNDLGLLLASHDDFSKAVAVYEEALVLEPNSLSILVNFASLKSSMLDIQGAEELYERSLVSQQSSPSAVIFYNYGVFQYQFGSIERARILWQSAIDVDESMYLSYANMATLVCSFDGDITESQHMYEMVIHLISKSTVDYKYDPAYWAYLFQKDTSVIPVLYDSLSHIRSVRLRLINNMKHLLEHHENFVSSSPFPAEAKAVASNMNPLNHIGCGAVGYYVIYQGFEDIYVRQLLADVYRQFASVLTLTLTHPFLNISNQRQVVTFPSTSQSSISFQLSLSTYAPIKLAFLSAFLYHHSVGLLLQNLIISLASNPLFEITIIALNQQKMDNVALKLQKAVHLYLPLYTSSSSVESFTSVRDKIISLELDILVYTEIGMDPVTYFLSFSRLAQRSLVFWGHAVSSGVVQPVVDAKDGFTYIEHLERYQQQRGGPDYFVSSKMFEQAPGASTYNSQHEYSERLLLLNSMTTFFAQPVAPYTRAEFASLSDGSSKPVEASDVTKPTLCSGEFPDKREYLVFLNERLNSILPNASHVHASCASHDHSSFNLFGVLQTLYKLHPDFDRILFRILHEDANGFIVFPEGANDLWSTKVMNRLKNTFTQLMTKASYGDTQHDLDWYMDRILFVRSMAEKEFITLAAVVDVMLDPFPVGGGRSSLEILSTGTPIVMLASRTSILQLTRAMYDTMGISNDNCFGCIAYSEDEYVRSAVKIASSTEMRTSLQTLIQSSNFRLYDNISVVEEWTKMLLFVLTVPRPLPILRTRSSEELERDNFDLDAALWEEMEFKSVKHSFGNMQPIYIQNVTVLQCNNCNPSKDDCSFCADTPKDSTFQVTVPKNDVNYLENESGHVSSSKALDVYIYGVGGITAFESGNISVQVQRDRERNAADGTLMFSSAFHYAEFNSLIIEVFERSYDEWKTTLAKLLFIEENDRVGMDLLKSLYITGAVGRGVLRTQQPFVASLEVNISGLFDDVSQSDHQTLQALYGNNSLCVEVDSVVGAEGPSYSCVVVFNVYEGDELGQVLWLYKKLFNFPDELVSYIAPILEDKILNVEMMSGLSWVALRHKNNLDWMLWYINADFSGWTEEQKSAMRSHRNAENYENFKFGEYLMWIRENDDDVDVDMGSSSQVDGALMQHGPVIHNRNTIENVSSETEEVKVSKKENQCQHSCADSSFAALHVCLGMTSSRRLNHFLRSMTALEANLGGKPIASVFARVLIVDDASTVEDRILMSTMFPSFQFILKSKLNRGHANSLNILSNAVTTRYLLYLEDDWLFMQKPIVSSAFGAAVERVRSDEQKRSDTLSEKEEKDASGATSLGNLVALVLSGLEVLRSSHVDNDAQEVHQVLFNEQSQRLCAIGKQGCDVNGNALEMGGWPAVTSSGGGAHGGHSIPYHLHEFGLMGYPTAYGGRNHDFTYWPGLSLNPGLWDMHVVKSRFSNDRLTFPHPHTIFNETNKVFEHQFSFVAWSERLQMAYFPGVFFEHIGDDISAYELNDIRRPWDLKP